MRGFTLVELIATLIILGVLAAVALPRFADRGVFESRGFRDETAALLRYAQKAAIAQRRTVCVDLSHSTGVVLTIASAPPPSTACDTPLALNSTPRGGAGLVPNVASFMFLASGSTDQAADVSIAISGSTGITVDAVTGYVY